MIRAGLPFDVRGKFEAVCKYDPEKSEAVAAIEVLTLLLRQSEVYTVQGLHDVMNAAIAEMGNSEKTNLSVKSACELFQRFITLTILDTADFDDCKNLLLKRAEIFILKVGSCRQQIAENFLPHLPDGAHVLLHSHSRVVLQALAYAAQHSSRSRSLHCYVTACMPGGTGAQMTKSLSKLKISCTLVPDTAIAYLMPQVDLVILGAEAVVESGGILNVLGSSLIAMTASNFGKPVYVLAESFKFIRCYPLDQLHIPDEFKWPQTNPKGNSPLRNIHNPDSFYAHLIKSSSGGGGEGDMDKSVRNIDQSGDEEDADDFPEMHNVWSQVEKHRVSIIEQKMPRIDYTSPSYITYLVSDLGILTPSAVSDELIKLYL